MGTKNGRASVKDGLEQGKATGRKTATDALRKEAELNWAESDRKAAEKQRHTQARSRQRGEVSDRDAEIKRLRGKLAQAEHDRGRKAR